tara:strand:+ start:15071 stop:15382 length:312 start_codon:yes stop_codon:yes gene_type:complete
MKLLLLSKYGCCLCDGLKSRLNEISLEKLRPSISLEIIYLEDNDFHKSKYDKYKYEVPLIFLIDDNFNLKYQFPRVSPRLKNNNLLNWLQNYLDKIFDDHKTY